MAAKRKTNTKKDLEEKIAELEAKLSKLSDQLDPPATKPKEAPKPAETAKPKPTLPKGSTRKPQNQLKQLNQNLHFQKALHQNQRKPQNQLKQLNQNLHFQKALHQNQRKPQNQLKLKQHQQLSRCIRKCIHECSND